MIDVRQGTPGSGKSAAAVAQAIYHLKRGGVVAANFKLVDGWAETVSANHPLSRLSRSYRTKLAHSLYNRFYYVDSLEAIKSLNPRMLATGILKDDGTYSEGVGLLILDECQLIFNSRKWEKNFAWIEFFTQHRKLGWDVLMIAHTIDMIDSQIRPLCEYESRFRNLQKVRIPVVGLPVSPIPAFLVITRYAGLGAGASAVHSRKLYKLPIWAAKLYDTLLVFSSDKWNENTLPVLCGQLPPPLCGGGGLFDIVSGYWRAFMNQERARLSVTSPDCLWSKFADDTNSDFPIRPDSEFGVTWPISLNDRSNTV